MILWRLKAVFFSFLFWLAFLLAGFPDYYQQYSNQAVALVILISIPVTRMILRKMMARFAPHLRWNLARNLAFYTTVPFFIFDFTYCGLYLGHGIGFLQTYWYLTIYYFLPWLILFSLKKGFQKEPF